MDMTDARTAPAPRRPGGVLVTGASGTIGRAVVDALLEAGESVVAGMRDPRAWIADGARRASGVSVRSEAGGSGFGAGVPGGGAGSRAGGARADGAGPGRPLGKPLRAPNQKPLQNPTRKPGAGAAAAAPSGRAGALAAAGHPAHTVSAASPAGASAATVRAFDFADRGTWSSALGGVDRVFLMLPPTIGEVGRTLIPFIDTAMENGVRQIVFLSPQGVPLQARSPQHDVERYLKRTRAPYTVLRPNVLLQSLSTGFRDDIRRRRELAVPAAAARVAFVDGRDVARVAARVLGEPGHLRKTYALSGEQALGYAQLASLLTEVLDRPIRYSATNEPDFERRMAEQGATPNEIARQSAVFRAVRLRALSLPNRNIRRLTGLPATTVRRFIEDHRDSWL